MASKAEKRLARKALDLQRKLEKSARQFVEPRLQRTVSQVEQVSPTKTVPETKLTPHQRLMCWDRSIEDCDGIWSWGAERKCSDEHWQNVVHPFLGDCATKRWGEIDNEATGKGRKRRKKHVYYTFDQLIPEAYERLIFLEIDDFAPNIFRFRISGKKRLFGFRIDALSTFYFVWFDPDHRLYQYKD